MLMVFLMGKFPAADAEITKVRICRRCKGRNSVHNTKCRRCGYPFLRPKNKTVRRKK